MGVFRLRDAAGNGVDMIGEGLSGALEEVEELINTIQLFNLELKRTARKIGFSFLDVHKLTDNGNGFSNGFWHIDNIHLSVSGMQEAWRRYGL